MPFFVFTKKVAKIILKQKTSPLSKGEMFVLLIQ
jgi:hypothetical protein